MVLTKTIKDVLKIQDTKQQMKYSNRPNGLSFSTCSIV